MGKTKDLLGPFFDPIAQPFIVPIQQRNIVWYTLCIRPNLLNYHVESVVLARSAVRLKRGLIMASKRLLPVLQLRSLQSDSEGDFAC